MVDVNPSNDPAGGAGDPVQTASADGDGKVDRKTYDKTVTENKTIKQQLAEERAKNKKFEDERLAREENERLAKNQHLEVIEEQKRKIAELAEQNESHARDKRDARKLNLALNLLHEKGVNLEPKYYGMIPLDQIAVDSDGMPDKTSVTKVISDFTKEHPRLTMPAKNLLPADRPAGAVEPLTVEAWGQLPYKEKLEALKQKRVVQKQK